MTESAFAQAAERNARPILEVLRREFRDCGDILEIGSGTGQHAVMFAAALDHLSWQTSDLQENHSAIAAWIAHSDLPNVHLPLTIDVLNADVPPASYDGAYSSNTAHIMNVDAVSEMLKLVARALRPDGIFCLYGPFRTKGRFNTASNERFDAELRRRDPAMGLRDLEVLDEQAANLGLIRANLYAMPSNNLIAVWRMSPGFRE